MNLPVFLRALIARNRLIIPTGHSFTLRSLAFFVLWLFALTQTGQAQIESEAFPVVGIQSPTAASLGKFGDIPVSLYTGMPQISIPLYTLNARTHGLPISLSYHASGLKVEKTGGWVGQNWALNAGGAITRTLRGLPDETGGGYLAKRDSLVSFLNKYPLLVGDLPRDPVLVEDWNYMNNIETRAWDSEPDAFFFNVAGMTGKFVFNEDPQAEEQIVLIARQPVCDGPGV